MRNKTIAILTAAALFTMPLNTYAAEIDSESTEETDTFPEETETVSGSVEDESSESRQSSAMSSEEIKENIDVLKSRLEQSRSVKENLEEKQAELIKETQQMNEEIRQLYSEIDELQYITAKEVITESAETLIISAKSLFSDDEIPEGWLRARYKQISDDYDLINEINSNIETNKEQMDAIFASDIDERVIQTDLVKQINVLSERYNEVLSEEEEASRIAAEKEAEELAENESAEYLDVGEARGMDSASISSLMAADEEAARNAKSAVAQQAAAAKAAEEEALRMAEEEAALKAEEAAEQESESYVEDNEANYDGVLQPEDYPESYTYGTSGGEMTKEKGVVYFNGHKETWYSERILPGEGLNIPGRYTDEQGLVRDGDGYICVASSDLPKGTVIETSLGMGKVYDSGCASGTIDIYTNW